MKHILVLALVLLCLLPPAAARADSKSDIMEMRARTLARFYKEEPGGQAAIQNSVGYAVFSSGGVNVILFSAAYGSGVAHDNKTGRDTFMKMASGGLGLGLGVKDYRLVFVFTTRSAFDQFVKDGWDFSGQADAAAKAGTSGGELSEAGDVMPGVKVYQMTESGLALQATLQGTKYWKD